MQLDFWMVYHMVFVLIPCMEKWGCCEQILLSVTINFSFKYFVHQLSCALLSSLYLNNSEIFLLACLGYLGRNLAHAYKINVLKSPFPCAQSLRNKMATISSIFICKSQVLFSPFSYKTQVFYFNYKCQDSQNIKL